MSILEWVVSYVVVTVMNLGIIQGSILEFSAIYSVESFMWWGILWPISYPLIIVKYLYKTVVFGIEGLLKGY